MSLRLEQVGKRVGGQDHLYPLDLALEPGLTVLLGPTGAGKTSLIRLMAGLDRLSAGRILAGGRDVTRAGLRGRSVAMVYQQFINYPSLTVRENIASPLRLARRPKAEIDARVAEVARLLRVEHLLDRLPGALSGGQQQRTAIGRALAKGAELLLLDEPLVNLDYKLREELRAELATLFARREAIVVYATTEPQEALLLGGQVVVMDAGRVLQAGPTVEVYRRPASTEVARVFSDPPMNVVEGRIEDGAVALTGGARFAAASHLRGLAAGPYRFGMRAGHLRLARASAGDVELPAKVSLAEVSGSETFIHAAYGGLDLVVEEPGIHALELGAPVGVFVDPARLYAFDAASGALCAAPEARLGG